MSILQISAQEFEKLLLLMMRVGGIIVVAPIFGHKNVPQILKIGLIVTISLIILPALKTQSVELPPQLLGLVVVLAKELIAGLAIGFSALMLFLAVQFGGDLIGLQMGFGIVNVIDPNSQTEVPLIGQFQMIITMMIFLALDGHYMIISAIVSSVKAIPLGQVNLTHASGEIILRAGINTLGAGIRLGAPCIVTLFLMDVAMGIIARTVPQMNIFIVGFPVKIGVGLLMISASLPLFGYVFAKMLGGLNGDINNVIMALRP
jgi:flagellar biosynthesis protein FliR